MNDQISEKQRNILEYIRSEIKDNGLPPTLREIRDKFSFASLASPRHHLQILAEQGYIKLHHHISRGIELLDAFRGIPVLGRISAGQPIEALENIEGYLDMVNAYSGKRPVFCLKVSGTSMIDAGIFEDDLIIVRKQEYADHGQIVVAMLDGESLVKRLLKKENRYYLHAENPDYPDVELKDGYIIGKVVGVLRNYEPVNLY